MCVGVCTLCILVFRTMAQLPFTGDTCGCMTAMLLKSVDEHK